VKQLGQKAWYWFTDSALPAVASAAEGFGDTLTTIPFTSWSLTNWVRKKIGVGSSTEKQLQESGWYTAGEGTAFVWGVAMGGAGTYEQGEAAGNWITRNVFRWGKGRWKGGEGWHFHLGFGEGLMKHHLPQQFNTWRYHAWAKLRRLRK
jgi:hypothetical protein